MSRNDDYREGYLAELARIEVRNLARDKKARDEVIARHPQHFGMDASEMTAQQAATHSLQQDGFKVLADEDAPRLRQAVDHGIALGIGRARGAGFAQDNLAASDSPVGRKIAELLKE